MIRLICCESDCGAAANVEGAQVKKTYKTFDVDLPLVEAWLRENHLYIEHSFTGIELLDKPEAS